MNGISVELAQDFRAVIESMTDEEFVRMLANTLEANSASRLTLDKNAYIDNVGKPQVEYTLKLHR